MDTKYIGIIISSKHSWQIKQLFGSLFYLWNDALEPLVQIKSLVFR